MTLLPERITTGRLTLTSLVEQDAEAMLVVLDDERMYQFTGGCPPTGDELRARYRRLATGRSADGSQRWFNWIVRPVTSDHPVGVIQATVAADGSTADVSWEVGVPWQGQGFAAESAAAVVDWLVAHGVGEVRALVHPEHVASSRVAARAGLTATDQTVDGERVWRLAVRHE